MIIAAPKEIKAEEHRVGLTPAGVRILTEQGHEVLVQSGAGQGCLIQDQEYEMAGARMVESAEELYEKAEMVIKVKEPMESEYPLLREGQILYAYLHLAPAADLTKALLESGIKAVAYETMQLPDGSLPLLTPMSEVAGRIAVQVGAHFLEKTQGGRGVLLGGVPGVQRGRVTIIGAGNAGRASAKIAIGMGAEVTLIDIDQRRLVYMDDVFASRVTTVVSNYENIYEAVVQSHLVIGSVLITGAKAPKLVTRSMIRDMKSRTVVADIAIDQGGCFESSKPTTHKDPIFIEEDIIHYCVPNMPSAVARTSTFALTNLTINYAVKLANLGFEQAVKSDETIKSGVNLYMGEITHDQVAHDLGYEYKPIEKAIKEKRAQ
jgi:alanine dehydrogenase